MTQKIRAVSQDPKHVVNQILSRITQLEAAYQEKRVDDRHTIGRTVSLWVEMPDRRVVPLCNAWAVDISRRGISLIVEQEFTSGHELFVNLEILTSQNNGLIPIRITDIHRLATHTNRISAIFLFQYSNGSISPDAA